MNDTLTLIRDASIEGKGLRRVAAVFSVWTVIRAEAWVAPGKMLEERVNNSYPVIAHSSARTHRFPRNRSSKCVLS